MQDGVSTKFGKDNGTWCCKTTKDECIRDGDNMICNGTVLSLTDQCHDENYDGPSCNYYPLDETRYFPVDYPTIHIGRCHGTLIGETIGFLSLLGI